MGREGHRTGKAVGSRFTVDQLPWSNLTDQPGPCFLLLGLKALVQTPSRAAALLPVAIILILTAQTAPCYQVPWVFVLKFLENIMHRLSLHYATINLLSQSSSLLCFSLVSADDPRQSVVKTEGDAHTLAFSLLTSFYDVWPNYCNEKAFLYRWLLFWMLNLDVPILFHNLPQSINAPKETSGQ